MKAFLTAQTWRLGRGIIGIAGRSRSLVAWLLLAVGPGLLSAAELPPLKHRTVVIAHRGEHQQHQENTLEAIQGSIAAGADFTEMDVRRSKDGRYLLMHDATVDRMTDGHGPVAEHSWAELARLVVQDRRLTNVPPSRIPLFEEALKACQGRVYIYLDFKAGDRRAVAKLVRAAGMERQVIVYDSIQGIPEWHKVAPELPIITSPTREASRDPKALQSLVELHHPNVFDEASENAFVEAATRLGIQIWPDIQRREETPAYWQSIWDRGIRGFQTDHPAELVRWLEQEGRR